MDMESAMVAIESLLADAARKLEQAQVEQDRNASLIESLTDRVGELEREVHRINSALSSVGGTLYTMGDR